jgi:hypothetical protein
MTFIQQLVGISCLFLMCASCSLGAQPDLTGKWVLDPSRSQDTNIAADQLTIQRTSGKLFIGGP